MCPAIAERRAFTVEHGFGETGSGDALRRSDAVFTAEARDKPLSQTMWRSIANSRLIEAREVRRLLVSDVAHPAFEVSARELLELAEKFPEAMPGVSTSEGQRLVARSIEASIEAADTGAITLACKRFGRDAREPPFVEHAIVLRAAREDRWFSAAFVIDSFAFDDERERARARDFVDPPTDLSKRERHAWARELLALLGPDAVWEALLREARACPQLGAELVVWFVENQDFSIEDGVYRFEHSSTRSAVTIRAVLALLAEREPALHRAVVERWSGGASELLQPLVR